MDLFNNRVSSRKSNDRIDSILRRSSRAVCGIHEREVLVKNSMVEPTKKLLKQKGNTIVGTGNRGSSTVIWFNPIGGF